MELHKNFVAIVAKHFLFPTPTYKSITQQKDVTENTLWYQKATYTNIFLKKNSEL